MPHDRAPVTNGVLFIALALCLVPPFAIGTKPPVWNELRTRPLLALVFVLAAVGGLTGFAWLHARYAWFLPLVSGGAVACALGLWWRARPGWGTARGLPPGSLGVGASLDAITHQDFYARRAAELGPVFKMAQFHRPVVVVTDLQLGLAVMESERANLTQPRLPFGRLSPGDYLEFMNDERHAHYRAILRTALSGRVVNECRDGVARVVREQLGRMALSPGAQQVSPDGCLKRIAFVSMLRVICGVSVDDPRIDALQQHFDELGTIRFFTERRPEERAEPFAHLVGLVRGMAEDVRAQLARGDVPERSVLSEIVRADEQHIADDTLLGNLVLIVHVTRSNVQGLLRWAFKELFAHPECVIPLRDAASQSAEGRSRVEALASNFVSEVLRLHQSEYFYREVTREIRVGDFHVPPGWLLRVAVREAHDNPDVFPEPGAFRPERFASRHYQKTEYCPFSDGAHSCFGAGLALMIARVLVSELAIEFDGRVVADGPAERDGNRHWSHWRPSRRFRVSLASRGRADEAAPITTPASG